VTASLTSESSPNASSRGVQSPSSSSSAVRAARLYRASICEELWPVRSPNRCRWTDRVGSSGEDTAWKDPAREGKGWDPGGELRAYVESRETSRTCAASSRLNAVALFRFSREPYEIAAVTTAQRAAARRSAAAEAEASAAAQTCELRLVVLFPRLAVPAPSLERGQNRNRFHSAGVGERDKTLGLFSWLS
jgi:hypothetical protein